MARTTKKKVSREWELEKERRTPVVEVEEVKPEHRTGRRVRRENVVGINVPTIKEMQKTGRPSIYDPFRFPHIAFVLCKERGFTNDELARVFDVQEKTVRQWVWLHPEFKEAVRRGKDEYDTANIENALRKRALGYKYDEVHVTKTKLVGKTPEGVEVTIPAVSTTVVTKEVAPDPRSIMYWLQNRQPDRWKNTAKVEIQIPNQNDVQEDAINPEDMDTQDLLVLRDMAVKAVELREKTIDVTPQEKRPLTVEEILSAADKAAEAQGVV